MSSAATIASTEARTEKPKKQGCKRPNYIASFSNHALSEMQKDGITKEQARDVIESRGTKVQDGNSKCSWKVTKGKITVVINEDANVITAWRSR